MEQLTEPSPKRTVTIKRKEEPAARKSRTHDPPPPPPPEAATNQPLADPKGIEPAAQVAPDHPQERDTVKRKIHKGGHVPQRTKAATNPEAATEDPEHQKKPDGTQGQDRRHQ